MRKTRLKEHKDACSKHQTEKSAVVEHAWEQDHPIEWNSTKILDRAKGHRELLLKEALHIQTAMEGSHFNRDVGVWLHNYWIDAIKRSRRRGRSPGR